MVCEDCKDYIVEIQKLKIKRNKPQFKKKGKITGYILFFQENRTEIAIQMNLENRKHTDGVREIGKMWKELSTEEKEKYNKLAADKN